MSGWIEIIIALIIVGLMARYLTYVQFILSFIPIQFVGLILFAISVSIVLFVIHRK